MTRIHLFLKFRPQRLSLVSEFEMPSKWKRFSSDEETINEVEGLFSDQPLKFYSTGINVLRCRLEKRIEIAEDYIEQN